MGDKISEAGRLSERLAESILDVIEEEMGDTEGGLLITLVALEQLLAAVATSAMETSQIKTVDEVVVMISGHLRTMMTNMLHALPNDDDSIVEASAKLKRRLN